MSSTVITVPLAKPPKKRAKSQRKSTGPTVSDLILKAVSTNTERSGMSLAALKKALMVGGYDVGKNRARILNAIRRLVSNKVLVQVKGTGASGSFKLNKKPPTPRKKVMKKKSKAKKVRRASTRKPAEANTPAAKKSPKKKRKGKSPKKAKRTTAAKKTAATKKTAAAKKPKSPKPRVSKSTRTRLAAKK